MKKVEKRTRGTGEKVITVAAIIAVLLAVTLSVAILWRSNPKVVESSERWQKEKRFDQLEEVRPLTEEKCPYEDSKCVANAYFDFENEDRTMVWDIYVYKEDGIVGTAIVNDQGRTICFYGDMFDKVIDGYNVHIWTSGDNYICVYPGDEKNDYTVVTYSE